MDLFENIEKLSEEEKVELVNLDLKTLIPAEVRKFIEKMEKENSIERFLYYKPDTGYNKMIDVDCLPQVKEVLVKMIKRDYPDINEEWPSERHIVFTDKKLGKIELETDTLCSFMTVFMKVIRCVRPNLVEEYQELYKISEISEEKRNKYIISNYNEIVEDLEKKCQGLSKSLKEFEALTHTIGNIGFVPKKYNGMRSSIKKPLEFCDAWDRSLDFLVNDTYENKKQNLFSKVPNHENTLKWYKENVAGSLCMNAWLDDSKKKVKIFQEINDVNIYSRNNFKQAELVELINVINEINEKIKTRGREMIDYLNIDEK